MKNSIYFNEILDYCQVEAIANKLSPNEESIYREICRSYSKSFNTPLDVVFTLDPISVVLNVYEERLVGVEDDKFENLEMLMEMILNIEDPEYFQNKESLLQKEIERYEKEEEERIKAGKPIHPSLAKKISTKTIENTNSSTKPKSGSLNLSHLDDQESEG